MGFLTFCASRIALHVFGPGPCVTVDPVKHSFDRENAVVDLTIDLDRTSGLRRTASLGPHWLQCRTDSYSNRRFFVGIGDSGDVG